MRESMDQCIVNCMNTAKESYPLFRSFGLNVVDQPGRLQRSQIQEQISIYYPDVRNVSIKQTGQNTFNVSMSGYNVGG